MVSNGAAVTTPTAAKTTGGGIVSVPVFPLLGLPAMLSSLDSGAGAIPADVSSVAGEIGEVSPISIPVNVSSVFAPIFPVPECEGDGGEDDSGAAGAATLFTIEDDNCPDSPVDVTDATIAAVCAIS